jgi:peroxiredoxin
VLTLKKGKPAPAFSLEDLSNNNRSLKEFRGKVVLLNFWATWCSPCKKELPYFDKMYRKYKKEGLVVLAVSTDSGASVSQVGPTVRRSGFSFPVLIDTEGKVAGLYNPKQRMPFSALIDRKGQIRLEHPGYTPGDEKVMEKLVKVLLKEK